MVATKAIVAAALVGSAAASAIPANTLKQGRSTIHQVKREGHVPNGAVSVYKTYMKYNTPIPDWLAAAVANATGIDVSLLKRDSGSETTTPIDSFDDAYVTPVSIGTPAQVLNLDFDTGSSDLWVFSSLTASADVDGQDVYTPGDSSTAELLSGETWDISYGDGSTSSGVVYSDTVTIGGVTVTAQAVYVNLLATIVLRAESSSCIMDADSCSPYSEAAETVSSSFTSEEAIDGLLGLGFNSLNTVSPTAAKTFWYNAADDLDEPVFSSNLVHNAAGTYDFGFIDDTAFDGDLTYTAVSKLPGYWKFTSTGYGIGDDFVDTSITGIADTGTTLIYVPAAVVKAYYAQVSSATNSLLLGGYIFDCDEDLPDFQIGIEDTVITVPGDYINYVRVSSLSLSQDSLAVPKY